MGRTERLISDRGQSTDSRGEWVGDLTTIFNDEVLELEKSEQRVGGKVDKLALTIPGNVSPTRKIFHCLAKRFSYQTIKKTICTTLLQSQTRSSRLSCNTPPLFSISRKLLIFRIEGLVTFDSRATSRTRSVSILYSHKFRDTSRRCRFVWTEREGK